MKFTPILLVIFFVFSSCISQKQALRTYQNTATHQKTYDAIVVPGMAFKKNKWSIFMKRRVLWSWVLYKQGIAKNIIYSGGAVYTPYHEAYVMGLYAKKLGIPEEHIFYDTVARHSIENVYYSYLIAQEQGFKTIALTTDRYQALFLRRALPRHFATPVHILPVVKDTVMKYDSLDMNVDIANARVPNAKYFKSIRKTENFFQRMKGTFGRNIPWRKYRWQRVPALNPKASLAVEAKESE